MKKKLKKLFLLLFVIIVIIFGNIIYQGYLSYKKAIQEMSIEEKINQIKSETVHYTEYDELPKDYINAVIAVEDRRFFEHNGVDIISILRAIYKDIVSLKLVEGGSTITQQLAKNTYFTQKKVLTRKIAEIFMAFQYEKNCNKEEILELYLNTIYFGDGYYCVYDASHGYFDKEPKDMNLYECTLLAGIPNAPSVYSPTVNPELAKQRHTQVLNKMLKYNYITQEQADKIFNEM